jgi:hypothetical protein
MTTIKRVGELVGAVLTHGGVTGGGPQVNVPQPR